MRRLLTSWFVLLLTAPALAQGLQNASIQTSPQNPPKQAGSSTTTLRTGTKLVVVDVTVTDQKHNPVHHLKASDFTLQENSVPQTVKSFEEHSGLTAADTAKIEPMPVMPAGVFSNFTPAPVVVNGPVNVMLIDRLNTLTEDQGRLRANLLEYLKKAKPGTRIAIFGLSTQLVLLQGFTGDPALLRAALEKKANPKGSPLIDATVASGGVAEPMGDKYNTLHAGDAAMDNLVDQIAFDAKMFETVIDAQQQMDRAHLTLEAMNALARYLVGIPGRKNLIWFSGSFPLDILPDAKLESLAEATTGVGCITVGCSVVDCPKKL